MKAHDRRAVVDPSQHVQLTDRGDHQRDAPEVQGQSGSGQQRSAFSAEFDIAGLASGEYEASCQASEQDSVPLTTIPSLAAAATTTTTSTMPEIALDLDLSELDELLGELNGLLGGLGSVMNQSEGEITP